jgi:SAM-dependent methyltransferase
VDAALDFGCGYGRVLRYVVQDIEPRRIWASDVDIDAVGFCASEFGVHPLFPTDSIAALMLSGFDLVYAFSVLTHLPESDGTDLLSFFGRALVPGGVIVFTTHGRASLARIDAYGDWCASDVPAIAEEMSDRGFSFRPYPHYRGDTYGMAWHDPDYVRAAVGRQTAGALELVHFGENALDGHQDVYVFRRA